MFDLYYKLWKFIFVYKYKYRASHPGTVLVARIGTLNLAYYEP